MKQDELDQFLAHVRRRRFIDYLDPIGITAEEALEQRLRWAERTHDDHQYGEEARFLLRNAGALRELVRQEAEEEDWVDFVEAGSEATPIQSWVRRDVAGPITKMPETDVRIETPPPAEMRYAQQSTKKPEPYLTRMEDITPPPMDQGQVKRALADMGFGEDEDEDDISDMATTLMAGHSFFSPDSEDARTDPSAPPRTEVPDLEEPEEPQRRREIPTPTPGALQRQQPEPSVDDMLDLRRRKSSDTLPRAVRSRGPLVLVLLLLVVVVGGGVGVWQLGLLDSVLGSTEPQPQPQPVVEVPEPPVPEPLEPEPLEPEPTEVMQIITEPDVPPEPAPAPGPAPSLRPVPGPAEPAPAPAPAPQPVVTAPVEAPAPQPVAPAPAPRPVAPSPRPSPRPSASMPSFSGLWVGRAGEYTFMLRIDEHTSADVTGTAEVKTDSGWLRWPIAGHYASGALSLAADDGALSGKLTDGSGSGEVTVSEGDTQSWSVSKR